MKKYNFDNLSLTHFSSGTISLDGGAMFGVVPKNLWSKVYPCDEQNRIKLGMNLLLIQDDNQNTLIDTGCLGINNTKLKNIYNIKNKNPFEKLGISEDEIDHVVLTHLHFDHAGGATMFNGKKWIPRFKNATYWIDKTEWQRATNPNEREKASYYPETFLPLLEEGKVQLISGNKEIIKNIFFINAPGHTPGHRIIKIKNGQKEMYYLADLVPTAKHLPIPWIMSYDLEPLKTLETRKKIYPEFINKNVRLFFEHDEEPTSGFAKEENKKITFYK